MCEVCNRRKIGLRNDARSPLPSPPTTKPRLIKNYQEDMEKEKENKNIQLIHLIGDLKSEVEFLRGCLFSLRRAKDTEIIELVEESLGEYEKLKQNRTISK